MTDQPLVHIVFPRQDRPPVDRAGHAVRRDGTPFRQRPLGLFVLAALARRCGWRVRIVDENREPIPAELPDLALITVWTCTAPSAYGLSERYRERGVRTVLGGVHASLLPGEALRHADAVVTGEAESILAEVLDDAASDHLQLIYAGGFADPELIPSLAEYHDLYTAGAFRRDPIHTIQTSRGCRFNCSFCSVIRMNGRSMRHKPLELVMEELELLRRTPPRLPGGTPTYIVDDDLMSDRDYSASLFEAIVASGRRVPLVIQASIAFGRDEELLDLAQRAGCVSVFIGLESISRRSLLEANKKNRPSEYRDVIDRIHRHRIGVSAGIIFGFDHDDVGVFDATVDMLDDLGVDSARFGVLTPLPGTQVFAEFYEQGRIIDLNWSRYDAMHTVIRPERMTPEELQAGLVRSYHLWFSRRARYRRFSRQLTSVSPRIAAAFALGARRYATDLDAVMGREDVPFQPEPQDLEELATVSRAPAAQTVRLAGDLAASRYR